MIMDSFVYKELESRFLKIFSRYVSALTGEAFDNVRHYIDVAELEMAYEAFVLSVIEEGVMLSESEINELLELGKVLGLDRDSVFREDFWELLRGLRGKRSFDA